MDDKIEIILKDKLFNEEIHNMIPHTYCNIRNVFLYTKELDFERKFIDFITMKFDKETANAMCERVFEKSIEDMKKDFDAEDEQTKSEDYITFKKNYEQYAF